MKKHKYSGFDDMQIIRVLDKLEKASAIDIRPTIILMHPKFFLDWFTSKQPLFFPPKDEFKFGSFQIKITPLVRTWGIITEPYGI